MTSGINYIFDSSTGSRQTPGRLAQNSGAGIQYFLTDALGSVRQVVDENGTIILSEGYQPYGELLDQAGDGASIFGFAGEAKDDTGLTYLRARYYQPGTGRFTQIDPSRLEKNLYQYAKGNPINRADPSGYFVWPPKEPYDKHPLCTVESGDALENIARLFSEHGDDPGLLYHYVDRIRYFNDISGDHIEDGQYLIIPYEDTDLQYHCPPSRYPHLNEFRGYIEGYSVYGGTCFQLYVLGREVVYNFITLERAEFTYHGRQDLVGYTTNPADFGVSRYAGYVNFPLYSDIDDYSEGTNALSLGLSATIPTLSSVYVGIQGTLFQSQSDPNLTGATFGVSFGASMGFIPFLSASYVPLYYDPPVDITEYSDFENMAGDIESGAPSAWLGFQGDFLGGRDWFANHLRWMNDVDV